MYERQTDEAEIEHALEHGETIEKYENDTPYPSRLILGWCNRRPIHVVAGDNKKDRETIIITVYEPNPKQWSKDFKRRIS